MNPSIKFLRARQVVTLVLLLVFLAGTSALVMAEKSSRKGYLGVSIERVSREEREDLGVSHGVIVTYVKSKSPADEAGILEDDVIQYFDGKKIRRPDDLVEAVRNTKPKTDVKVTLVRDGKRLDIDVNVGKLSSPLIYSWRGDDDVITIVRGGGGYLGVQLHELNANLAGYFGVQEDGGALILEVEEDSPAADAGIEGGDVIVSMDGEDVIDPQDVHEILSDFEEGDEIEIEIIRHKKKQTVEVELDEHPHYSSVKVLKGLREFDGIKRMNMHIDIPRDLHIEIPDIIFENDFDCDFEMDIDEDIKDRLQEKLDGIRYEIKGNLKDKLKDMKRRLKRIKEIDCI